MQQFTPENEADRHGRDYLLDVLEQLALPEEGVIAPFPAPYAANGRC